jgi:hypothetical protein
MKLAAAFVCGSMIATSVFAERVTLTKSEDGSSTYYGYTETFRDSGDSWTMLISVKEYRANEERVFIKIKKEDCNNKFGVIFGKAPSGNWIAFISFAASGDQVGDHIARMMCDAGDLIEESKGKVDYKKVM